MFWQHGTPQNGVPPQPLIDVAGRFGVRWLSHDRPGYAGSDALPGRDVASVAADVAAIADAAGIERLAVMGASGGGPHALACAALLGTRVSAAATLACPAPYDAEGLDWYAGMGATGAAEFRAAAAGRGALQNRLATETYDTTMFTPADYAALEGEYAPWLLSSLGDAMAHEAGGLIADDLAFVSPWGFELIEVAAPLLLVHGVEDRFVPIAHGRWLAARCPDAELREIAGAGHLSVFDQARSALAWLVERPR